jgi:hypothetical protein
LVYQDQYDDLFDALTEAHEDSSQYETDPLDAFSDARALLDELKKGTPSSPQVALDYIPDAAIDRFGLSAHDMFSAVFNFASVMKRHQLAFRIKYEDFETALSALSSGLPTKIKISRDPRSQPGPFCLLQYKR